MKRYYTVCSTAELRQLCIDNDWFTEGSIRQYEKMFDANCEVKPIEFIATIIWTCSNAGYEDILAKLNEKMNEYLKGINEEE